MERVPLEKLRELASAVHTTKLCRWLERNGIAYRLDCEGEPVVLKSTLERAFEPVPPAAAGFTPDFSKMEGTDGKKTPSRRRAA